MNETKTMTVSNNAVQETPVQTTSEKKKRPRTTWKRKSAGEIAKMSNNERDTYYMHWKPLATSAVASMTEDEQKTYWKEFQTYIDTRKKKVSDKMTERENKPSTKRKNRATFILFNMARKNCAAFKEYVKQIAEKQAFDEYNLQCLNELMADIGWNDINFTKKLEDKGVEK